MPPPPHPTPRLIRIAEPYPTPLMQSPTPTPATISPPGQSGAHPIESPDYDDPTWCARFSGQAWIPPCGSTTFVRYRLDLHDFRSSGVRRGRGHATGELWNPDGTHVATVTQDSPQVAARFVAMTFTLSTSGCVVLLDEARIFSSKPRIRSTPASLTAEIPKGMDERRLGAAALENSARRPASRMSTWVHAWGTADRTRLRRLPPGR